MVEQADSKTGENEARVFTTPDCTVIAVDSANDFMLLETCEPEPRRVLFGLSQYANASGMEVDSFQPGAVIRWSVSDDEVDLTGNITLFPPEKPGDVDTSGIIADYLRAGAIK